MQWGFLLWGYLSFWVFTRIWENFLSNVQGGDNIYMGTCAHAYPNGRGRIRGCERKRMCAQVWAYGRTCKHRRKRMQVCEQACASTRAYMRAPMRAPQPSGSASVRMRGRTNHAHTHTQAPLNTPHPTNGGTLRHLTARLRAYLP